MDTPKPIDVTRFKNILANAKKVMKVSDEKFPEPRIKENKSNSFKHNNYSEEFYNESDEKEFNFGSEPLTESNYNTRDYTEEDVINSNLPPLVKEAMLNKHIPKLIGLPSKVNLEDLQDLVEKPKIIKKPTTNKLINESYSKGVISISIDELNEIIDRRVNEAISKLFVKTLTEQTIKKTVNTLLKESNTTNKKK